MLMKSFNGEEDLTEELVADHEKRTGTDVKHKAQFRAKYLDPDYKVLEGADQKGPHLEMSFKR